MKVRKMKTVNPIQGARIAKALKPRNPVLTALKARAGGAGSHEKKRGSVRRAEKMALVKLAGGRED
jgi:hypothetical protein